MSTYIEFDDMVEKPSVSAFQNFLQIENQLNIKKVIGIECIRIVLEILMPCVDSVDIGI